MQVQKLRRPGQSAIGCRTPDYDLDGTASVSGVNNQGNDLRGVLWAGMPIHTTVPGDCGMGVEDLETPDGCFDCV